MWWTVCKVDHPQIQWTQNIDWGMNSWNSWRFHFFTTNILNFFLRSYHDSKIIRCILQAIVDNSNEMKYRNINVKNVCKLFQNSQLCLQILTTLGFHEMGENSQRRLFYRSSPNFSHITNLSKFTLQFIPYDLLQLAATTAKTVAASNIETTKLSSSKWNSTIYMFNFFVFFFLIMLCIIPIYINFDYFFKFCWLGNTVNSINTDIDVNKLSVKCQASMANMKFYCKDKVEVQNKLASMIATGHDIFWFLVTYSNVRLEIMNEDFGSFPKIVLDDLCKQMKYFDFMNPHDVILFKKLIADRYCQVIHGLDCVLTSVVFYKELSHIWPFWNTTPNSSNRLVSVSQTITKYPNHNVRTSIAAIWYVCHIDIIKQHGCLFCDGIQSLQLTVFMHWMYFNFGN